MLKSIEAENKWWEHLRWNVEGGIALTENGAVTLPTTGNATLDLFGLMGAKRNDEEGFLELLSKSLSESPLVFNLATIMYLMDIRNGLGERKLSRLGIKEILNSKKPFTKIERDYLDTFIDAIPKYGRWDTVVDLACEGNQRAIENIKSQLYQDVTSRNGVSLLGKWLPSENASSKETKRKAHKMMEILNLTNREYRKTLSALRKRINIVETHLTNKEYESIDYSKVPSLAMMKYREAFNRNDWNRYSEWLNGLSEGSTKVNTGTLTPVDVYTVQLDNVDRCSQEGVVQMDETWRTMIEEWMGLNNRGSRNKWKTLVMADTSGSMYVQVNGSTTAIDVSLALALFISELNTGTFRNSFLTFSANPNLIEVEEGKLSDKIEELGNKYIDWGMSTNIEKAMEMVLQTSIDSGIEPNEIIDKIMIISDMEFDEISTWSGDRARWDETAFETMKTKFKAHGYDMPKIVFWNVNSRNNKLPVAKDELGTFLVSGFSHNILNQVMSGDMNPQTYMLNVLKPYILELVG